MINKNRTKEEQLEEIFELLSKLESTKEEVSESLNKLEPRIKVLELETEIFVAIVEMIQKSKNYAEYESRIKKLPNKLYFFIDTELNNDK